MRERHMASVEVARRALLAADQDLQSDLAAYPTPIAGCDEQYTYLLAERRRVRDALEALDAIIHVPTPRRLEAGDRMESR